MKKVLFLDRDGTLIAEPPDEQVDSIEKLSFLPGVFRALSDIAAAGEYELVIVSNQDGLGTKSFPEEEFWPVHNAVMRAFEGEGVVFSNVLIDRHMPADNAPTRKPGIAMLQQYTAGQYDLAQSYVVGDRRTDMELARNLGARGIWIADAPDVSGLESTVALVAQSWRDIVTLLLCTPRSASVQRATRETNVRVDLLLDGSGCARIHTGLGFFDHLLEQFAFHSRVDLTVDTKADLYVDEHHCMEDTAIALGQAVLQALGNRAGMERYGFCLPMDESEAHVSLDLGGRSWLVWNAEFRRERIGDVPTEMFMHVFKSFCDAAQCTAHVAVSGVNEHHKIESIFKAFGRAFRAAIQRDIRYRDVPSTKGVL